jgi:hypothetical protein
MFLHINFVEESDKAVRGKRKQALQRYCIYALFGQSLLCLKRTLFKTQRRLSQLKRLLFKRKRRLLNLKRRSFKRKRSLFKC